MQNILFPKKRSEIYRSRKLFLVLTRDVYQRTVQIIYCFESTTACEADCHILSMSYKLYVGIMQGHMEDQLKQLRVALANLSSVNHNLSTTANFHARNGLRDSSTSPYHNHNHMGHEQENGDGVYRRNFPGRRLMDGDKVQWMSLMGTANGQNVM